MNCRKFEGNAQDIDQHQLPTRHHSSCQCSLGEALCVAYAASPLLAPGDIERVPALRCLDLSVSLLLSDISDSRQKISTANFIDHGTRVFFQVNCYLLLSVAIEDPRVKEVMHRYASEQGQHHMEHSLSRIIRKCCIQ